MKHQYDLFEKFPDGSSLWQDSVPGFGKTYLRLQELAQRSENEFYAIDLTSGKVVAFNSERGAHGFRESSQSEKRSKSQAA
jgi:hypothetical protein